MMVTRRGHEGNVSFQYIFHLLRRVLVHRFNQ
jgi:hypothetical protein